ncbi:MAG: CAP domain-containing protein [Gammaproteobacteria bacterium]
MLASALALALASPAVYATAAANKDTDELVGLINAYRAAPPACDGRAGPASPLTPHPALSSLRIRTGTLLEPALEQLGYHAENADAISVNGAEDAKAAMATIRQRYCRILLNPEFSAIGVARHGQEWQIVLGQPVAPLQLAPWPDAGQAILAGVNAARASGRVCGERYYPPAPPVTWSDALGQASLAHSSDMAANKYFAHKARDGSVAGERALRAGYHWRVVGENIAVGQLTPEEAVAGWLASPGHCVNVMHPGFTEMGAAYAVRMERYPGRVYWTQVFAAPR